MRLKPVEIGRHLDRGELPGVILLFGEESLLIEESLDALRRRAAANGFADRTRLSVEARFDWSLLDQSSRSMSLFAERQWIELRLDSGRPGDAGAAAIQRFCKDSPDDVVLVIICGRFDARMKQAKWVKSVDQRGWVVEHAAVGEDQFPNWLKSRLARRDIPVDSETLSAFVYYLQGNLLAAAQEVERIALVHQSGGDSSALLEGLTDHARFNVYTFADACLIGDSAKALRVLATLKSEGVEPILILWALSREVRGLVQIEHGLARGEKKGVLFKKYSIWSKKAPMVNAALSRLKAPQPLTALRQLARCDRVLKGRESGNIWHQLEKAALILCGLEPVAMGSE